ncbi:hypothetical protein [Pseudomonas sp. NA-150]|uniref:hypothetical protein n=1 Tax=Pseudomonas sp. NA-150 TaxID=3367525 RepID=UPI0037CAA81A
MIRQISLSVSFPQFGNNYYSQKFIFRQQVKLINDSSFAAFLMPSATNHFNNEVVGLNDQFRFLSDVLSSHLLDLETGNTAPKSRPSMQRRSA